MISRVTQYSAEVVVVELEEGGYIGLGECELAEAFDPAAPDTLAGLESVREALAAGAGRDALQSLLPPGGARCAADCALWSLEEAKSGRALWDLAGTPPPENIVTAFTLSLDTPEGMAAAARRNASQPLLKLKLGGQGDDERVAAVREAVPSARLIADANEAWDEPLLARLLPAMQQAGIELLEQPLPRGQDACLSDIGHLVPLCADESFHDRRQLDEVLGRYDYGNIKLDKTGGLTEALALAKESLEAGLGLMVGCMVGTSLAMRAALPIAALARFVDLDGPLLLSRDRQPALRYERGRIFI